MQAGGRRFDPVQLHQSRAGILAEMRTRGVWHRIQKQAALTPMPFASGLLNQCYRLFFNNTGEVKQFLLFERGGRRKPSFRRVGRDGLDCIEPAVP